MWSKGFQEKLINNHGTRLKHRKQSPPKNVSYAIINDHKTISVKQNIRSWEEEHTDIKG